MSSNIHTLHNDEVKIVLHNHYGDDNFEIINVTLLPYFNNINGFMGQHISLVIELKRNGKLIKEKFFAKYMPSEKSPFAKHMIDGNGYNKEVFFYTKFMELAKKSIKNFNVRVAPTMLYKSTDKLIFNDLAIEGYKSVNFEDVTKLHITNAMKVIAKLHAVGFAIDEYESKKRNCNYKLIDEYPDIFIEPLFSTNKNLITHKLAVTAADATTDLIDFLSPKLTPNEIENFRKEFSLQFNKTLEIFSYGDKKYRRVTSHGDLWLNNIVYKYEDGKVVDCLMVDFQYVRYAPPAHDVTFTIYYNTNKELRDKYYEEFLKTYYDTLTIELDRYGLKVDELLPLNEYEESCKMYLTIAKIIKGIYTTINDIPQKRLQMLTSNSEEFFNFLLVDRKPLARKLMKEEPIYCKIICENLMDIYEGIFSNAVK